MNGPDGIGPRIREERVRAGLSQRELARRLGLSPSLISQLEAGVSNPSVATLYAIVTELGLSLDRVIRGEDFATEEDPAAPSDHPSPHFRPGERRVINLASGVSWEQLACGTEPGVDFLHATYEVGGTSTVDNGMIRHHGREYGYIISGRLGVRIGFDEYALEPGDSIVFDSTTPHQLRNLGDEPVHAIWLVLGREGDPRAD